MPNQRCPNSSCTSTAKPCTTWPRSHCFATCTDGRKLIAVPYEFQIAADAAHPHEQADWWAETLGWVVEPSDEAFIRRMIAEGYATDDDTTIHNGALVWREG